MKKLLLSILLLGGLSASAQTKIDILSLNCPESETGVVRTLSTQHTYVVDNNGSIVKIYDPLFNDVKLERVSYRNEKYGTSIDQSKEVQFRKSKIAEYKKLGYAFDGMVTGANGKFMKFVK